MHSIDWSIWVFLYSFFVHQLIFCPFGEQPNKCNRNFKPISTSFCWTNYFYIPGHFRSNWKTRYPFFFMWQTLCFFNSLPMLLCCLVCTIVHGFFSYSIAWSHAFFYFCSLQSKIFHSKRPLNRFSLHSV